MNDKRFWRRAFNIFNKTVFCMLFNKCIVHAVTHKQRCTFALHLNPKIRISSKQFENDIWNEL